MTVVTDKIKEFTARYFEPEQKQLKQDIDPNAFYVDFIAFIDEVLLEGGSIDTNYRALALYVHADQGKPELNWVHPILAKHPSEPRAFNLLKSRQEYVASLIVKVRQILADLNHRATSLNSETGEYKLSVVYTIEDFEQEFVQRITSCLIQGGLNELSGNYRIVSGLFQEDKKESWSNEVKNTVRILSQNESTTSPVELLKGQSDYMDTLRSFGQACILNTITGVVPAYASTKKLPEAKLDNTRLESMRLRLAQGFKQQLLKQKDTSYPLDKSQLDVNRSLSEFYVCKENNQLMAPINWLNFQLGSNQQEDVCKQIINTCYYEIVQTEAFSKPSFHTVSGSKELRKVLVAMVSGNHSQSKSSLIISLINLVDESIRYENQTEQVQKKKLAELLKQVPYILSGLSVGFLAKELLTVYAVCYVLHKGGNKLDQVSQRHLRIIGNAMQELGKDGALTASIILVRITGLIFWASNKSLSKGVQVASSLMGQPARVPAPLTAGESSRAGASSSSVPRPTSYLGKLPFFSGSSSTSEPSIMLLTDQPENEDSFLEELKEVVALDDKKSLSFETLEYKLIAAPLQAYLALNAKQYFKAYRPGLEKGNVIQGVLFNLKYKDKSDCTLIDKLNYAQEELLKIKTNTAIYVPESKAAKAVDQSQMLIDLFVKKAMEVQPLLLTNTTNQIGSL